MTSSVPVTNEELNELMGILYEDYHRNPVVPTARPYFELASEYEIYSTPTGAAIRKINDD